MPPKEISGKITALGVDISVSSTGDRDDYISLTDIARYRSDEPGDVVKNWMRSRETIEFLGVWERLHNPDFKEVDSTSLGWSLAATPSPCPRPSGYDRLELSG